MVHSSGRLNSSIMSGLLLENHSHKMDDFAKTFENEEIACFRRKGWSDDFKPDQFDGKQIIYLIRLRDPDEYRSYDTMMVVRNTNQ